jgi:hypothetical protein
MASSQGFEERARAACLEAIRHRQAVHGEVLPVEVLQEPVMVEGELLALFMLQRGDPQAAATRRCPGADHHSCEARRRGEFALAEQLATQRHAGQTDKLGEPYIDHPRRVAAWLTTPETRSWRGCTMYSRTPARPTTIFSRPASHPNSLRRSTPSPVGPTRPRTTTSHACATPRWPSPEAGPYAVGSRRSTTEPSPPAIGARPTRVER